MEPMHVIWRHQVFGRRHPLDRMADFVDVVLSGRNGQIEQRSRRQILRKAPGRSILRREVARYPLSREMSG
jgi:hypothetical protein